MSVLLQGCGGGDGTAPSGPPAATVASVDVSPTSASMLVGGTTALTASPRSSTGAAVSGRTINWTSNNSAVATVSSGTVTGVSPGIATITATSDGKSGSAQITVTAPQPATIVVISGDSATGEPGKLLSAVPAVVVRTAAGDALPGVTVQFTIDSGGGSITNSTVTSSASGEASVGGWTLGLTEGTQVLGVTAGALPKVRIRATARVVPTTVTSGTVTTGVGTITVNQPSSPLHGLSISFPANAVQTAAPITLSIASTLDVTLRTGARPSSPALAIATTIGTLNSPAIIRFPVRGAPGTVTLLGMYNPGTGGFSVLPPLGSDSVSVTAVLPALDVSAIATNPSARRTVALRAAQQEAPLLLFTIAVDPAVLAKDYDSNFRAQRDNWDFDNFPIAKLPFLSGGTGGNPGADVIDPSAGMIATELWYFENQQSGGPLYGRFRKQADQPKSNKMGIRWSALANGNVNDPRGQVSSSHQEWISNDPAVFTNTQFKAVKVMFFDSYDRPVPVILYDLGNPSANIPARAVGMGIVTRTIGNSLEIVVPDNKEAPYTVQVTEQGVTPFTIVNRNGGSYRVNSFSPLNQRTLISAQGIASRWTQVVAGTVGDADGWPSIELHYEKAKLDTASVFIAEPLRHWWQCAGCPDYGFAPPGLPSTASKVQGFQMAQITNGSMPPLPDGEGLLASTKWTVDSVSSATAPSKTGHVIYLPQPQSGTSGVAAGWLDWHTVTYKRVELEPAPASLTISKDTTATFTLTPSQPVPSGTKYAWVLRTDTERDSVETATPTFEKNLRVEKKAMLIISALEPVTRRVIARDSVEISVLDPAPHWMVTSIADQDSFFEEGAGASFPAMARALGTPKAAMISVDSTATGSDLVFRVRKTGTWENYPCCPPVVGDEHRLLIGQQPRKTYGFGSFFAMWDTNWSQSSTNLDEGTMSSQYVDGTRTYDSFALGSQFGPNIVWQLLNTTRNGSTMTGTMKVTGWFSEGEGENRRITDETYRFPFTATRIR